MIVGQASLCHAREGTNAPTQSGRLLEGAIEGILREKGFQIVQFSAWNESQLHRNPSQKFVIKDAPYNSIFGHRAKIEFLIVTHNRQVLVETKRQKHPGSTDEKLPYVYQNAVNNLPERETVLVMSGQGWKPGARAWIEKQAKETDGFHVS